MSRFHLVAFHLSVSVFAVAAVHAVPVQAAEPGAAQAVTLNLPAQALGRSIQMLGLATGQTIIVDARLVEGRQAPALAGHFTVEDGLTRLLEGSALTIARVGNSLVVRSTADAGSDGTDRADAGIVVTGSRIRGAPLASPLIRIDIETIRAQGQADLGEVARSLPQSFGGGQNPGVGFNVPSSTGGNVGGGSTVNLRGLGSDATLTILNGRRVPYDSARQGVDISAIPLSAVERIEVVADGASAIYGADAVGGVVNVILRQDYEGVEARARIGGSPDGGNFQQQYSVLGGARWTGGGGFLTYEYGDNSALMTNQRQKFGRIRRDLTLLPASTRNAVAGSLYQDLTDTLHLEFDGLYNDRTGDFSYPTSLAANLSTSRITQSFKSDMLALAAAARLDLGRWEASLTGTFGKGKTYYQGDTYINDSLTSRAWGRYNNQTVTGEVAGDGPLFRLPGGEAKLAVGAGVRANDFEIYRGEGNINNARPSQDSYYAFGEASFPLIGPDQAIPMIRSLNLTGALRYERYKGIGELVTPKLGLIYAPTDFMDIKASWGKSFKAPTFMQLYGIEQLLLYPISSLGGSGFPAGTTVLYRSGGNSDLKPEKARSWSATLDLHPPALPGASLALGYFHTHYIDRIVNPIPVASRALSDPTYAAQVSYWPDAQTLAGIIAGADQIINATGTAYDPARVGALVNGTYVNAGRQTIQGIDILARYQSRLRGGMLNLSANITYLDSEQQLTPASLVQPLAGTLFNPPHWRGRAMANWGKGGFSLAGTLNYTGGVTDARTSPAVKVDGITTFDLSSRYRFGTEAGPLRGVEVSLSVQNLLNALPDIVATSLYAYAPYDSTNYSPVGRFIAFELVKKW